MRQPKIYGLLKVLLKWSVRPRVKTLRFCFALKLGVRCCAILTYQIDTIKAKFHYAIQLAIGSRAGLRRELVASEQDSVME